LSDLAAPVDRLQELGAIDAETDFRPDFFIPSSSWSRVRDRERPIVVGRKGTGKTALRKALLNEAANSPLVFATDLAFRDYPWNAHNEVFDSAVGATSRFLETWQFLMLIELAKQTIGESLKTMADTRIRVLLETSSKDPWTDVFEEQEMRGTQHKYSHMVQRTYLRPRDLIQFINLCLAEARSRRQPAPSSSGRVTNDDVTHARTPYSKYLRNELADEVSAHYPQWEQWTELLRRIGLTTFRRPAFEDECARASKLAAGAEPTEILEALYSFGIIGYGRIGGAGLGGTDEYWDYRDPDVAFDPDAPYFKVHPGLKEHLDLREPRA